MLQVKARVAILTLVVFFVLAFVYAQTSAQADFDNIKADQSFRDAVVKFNEGLYGEATLYFQEAISLRPLDKLAQTWLGRAYFHAGFEEAALREWELVARQGGAGPALVSFMEYIQARQGLGVLVNEDQAFLPIHEISKTAPVSLFRRPSSVLSLPEGRTLVTSFATNALAVVDSNGRIIQTLRGGLTRMQGPFDMTLANGGRLFVSQFMSNQIFEMNLSGTVVKKFGSAGIGPGQFMGPQFLSTDKTTFLYISDAGNRKIHKYALDGTPVLSFGEANEFFDGLEKPTGLVWAKGIVYVLDSRRLLPPRLLLFDESGNLLESLENEVLARAEGISIFNDDVLLVASGPRLVYFNIQDQSFRLAYESPKARTRYTKAGLDANGNMFASDFDNEKIEILTRLAGQYSGLHVQIQRVYTNKFPEVRVELQVTDNTGRPIVGLDQGNFSLTEGLKPLNSVKLVSAGHRETQLEVMLLLDASFAMSDPIFREAANNAVRDLYAELGKTTRLGLVSAGSNPVLEAPLGSTQKQLASSLSLAPAEMAWSFDRGLRLAVPELIKAPGLKHIIFLSTGSLSEDAFANYGIQETLSYLRNNRIRFSILNLGKNPIDPALEYLQRESGGLYNELYQTTGLAGLKDNLLVAKDGSYAFTYRSSFDSDFGRKYLPVEVEARLFQKSGRDESGYFAPLKF